MGAVFGVFVRGVEGTGGEFEQIFTGGVAVLFDQGDGAVGEERDDDGAAIVGDDLAVVFGCAFGRGLGDAVFADVENAAVINDLGRESFGHRQ